MANTLKCENCCYHWREEWEKYPCCHWVARCPDDCAPCEYDETDYTDTESWDDWYGEV